MPVISTYPVSVCHEEWGGAGMVYNSSRSKPAAKADSALAADNRCARNLRQGRQENAAIEAMSGRPGRLFGGV